MKEFMVHKYMLHKIATLLDNKKCRGYLILGSHKYGWMLCVFHQSSIHGENNLMLSDTHKYAYSVGKHI